MPVKNLAVPAVNPPFVVNALFIELISAPVRRSYSSASTSATLLWPRRVG